MNTFKQKTILITGASGGIGAAMARQLADPSVTLLLTARSEEALRTVAADAEAHGTQTAVFPRDLSRPGAAEALHDAVTDAGFAPDVLVGNAGFGALGRFESESAQTYAEMLTLNVVNLTTLTRRCLPHMLDADAGNGKAGLLNVASTAAHQPLPYFAVYAASKSYVLHFSQALWAEYRGRGLTVTCLSPGPTRTGFQTRAGSMSSLTGSLESAEKVARTGLRALLNGRHAVVSGAGNKAGALLGRLSPRRAVLAIMERAFNTSGDPSPGTEFYVINNEGEEANATGEAAGGYALRITQDGVASQRYTVVVKVNRPGNNSSTQTSRELDRFPVTVGAGETVAETYQAPTSVDSDTTLYFLLYRDDAPPTADPDTAHRVLRFSIGTA